MLASAINNAIYYQWRKLYGIVYTVVVEAAVSIIIGPDAIVADENKITRGGGGRKGSCPRAQHARRHKTTSPK